jgi:ABC-2 type transport system permease protein
MGAATGLVPHRGVSGTYLLVELRRAGTRLVTLVFSGVMPILFYLLFGAMQGTDTAAGRGNSNAVILVFMGFYGAAMTAASEALTVAHERPLGWNRTLRLTPMRPWAYIATKVLTALVSALASVVVLFAVGLILGQAAMPWWLWGTAVGIAMVGAVTFGALGQVICLLFKGDVATGLIIPILMVCCFLSGVFAIPISGAFFTVVQQILPMGGLVNLTLALFGPDVTAGAAGGMAVGDVRIWANLLGWLVVFFAAAAWAWSRDTKRQ